MKKTWRQKHRYRIPVWIRTPVLIFIIIWFGLFLFKKILPGVNLFGLPRFSESIVESLARIPSQFIERDILIQELADVRFQNRTLQTELRAVSFLKEENTTLLTLLGGENSTQGVLGSVVAWPPKTAYDTLVIMLSKDDAVNVGDIVFGQGLVPIGRIESVDGNFVTARLFSSSGIVTQVRLGSERFPAELIGKGGGSASIVVPKELPASIGDSVFFPYNGSVFMGVVGSSVTNVSSPTKELWISFPKNLFANTWVSISPFIESL